MSEALLDKKFEYWQNQLLDLGKRNRMINYRETKRATLKLVEPGFEELFRRVAVEEDELTFQSPIDKNSDIRTYSLLSLLETLSCPIPVNIGDIKTEGSILERQKTLKQLRAKSRLALDEQGTNILCYLLDGVGSKLLLYIDKYNRNDKNYFILATELLEKLYVAIEARKTKDVFRQSTISSAIQMLGKNIDILQDALEMYTNNRQLLLSPEKIVVAEYCMVMEQITEYQNVRDSKAILEKTLKSVLGDKIGTEINNLQEFKQGLQAVEMVKKMFVNVPNTIRDIMVFRKDATSLEYTEELADKVVSDLDEKLQNIDVKSFVCEELQKRIESLLYNCEELQSESEGVIAFCKPSKENIDVMDCLEKLEAEQTYYKALADNATNHINRFGSLYEGVDTDWGQVLLVMQKCILMNELACKTMIL